MWSLYIAMSVLAAGVCIKMLQPLMGRGRHHHDEPITPADRKLMYGLTGAIPVLAITLYMLLGHPDLPGAPAIFADLDALIDRQKALLENHPFQVLLEENPDDLGALVQLAYLNTQMQRYDESAKFYKRVVVVAERLNDPFLDIYARDLGVAQVKANKGVVGDDALGTFDFLFTLQPKNPIGRYYVALAKAQRGNYKQAIAEWEQILSEGPSAEPWKPMVRDALSKANADLRKQENGQAK